MLLSSEVSPYLAVFGRFHIVLLHLPIGLIPGMLLLEYGAAVFRRPLPRGAILALAVMTAMTSGAALASGLVLAGEKVDSELLGDHKIAAIVMTVICGLLPFVAMMKARLAFRLLLLVAVGVSVWTGHLGGSLTHKKDFLLKPLQRRQAVVNPSDANPVAPRAAKTRFQKEVQPIFERVCTNCHNPEDYDGDFDLTSKAEILQLDLGEEERNIMPGKPDESWLIEACELPADDEDRMPPEDEEAITKEEIAVLRRWIADGCPFE